MKLESSLSEISGLGPKTIAKLERLGLVTVEDLLFYFPRRYEDYTKITRIADLGSTQSTVRSTQEKDSELRTANFFTVKGTVLGIANKKTRRRGFTVTEAQIVDESGTLKVVWFNQPYLLKMLPAGRDVVLHGRVNFDQFSQGLVMESPVRATSQRIVPVYGETAGITSFFIAKLFGKVKVAVNLVEEWLPKQYTVHSSHFIEIKDGQNSPSLGHSATPSLLPIQDAILNIHEPKNAELLQAAQRRFAFDELFMISLRANLAKEKIKKRSALAIETDLEKIKAFIAKLPFELTGDQKRAIWDIVRDLAKPTPMNRLLNGDVGSGKTVVAAVAADLVVSAGQKVVIMAPTAILANQHYETFSKIFEHDEKVTIGLITADRQELNHESGIMNHGTKKEQKIHNSEFIIQNSNVIVGTHALIQPEVKLENVGLVVVDEQHRFGVKQRAALQQLSSFNYQFSTNDQLKEKWKLKNENSEKAYPHFLSMTATPIPRTLQLALFGDLDFSIIREKPADRKEIKTRFVDAYNRDKAYNFVREQLKAGRQAFVICPLIEEQGTSNEERVETLFEEERKTVMSEAEKLQKLYPEHKIATLHGRMKAKDKDAVMAEFSSGRVNILVSTSVVEVGVDIPNASVMMIEDAEKFGLAQIHQFRGRVGRAEHQSFCFLFSNTLSDKALSRLRGLETIADGFKLAELDLEMRGPGAMFGTEQSGVLDLKMASFSDTDLLDRASRAAKEIAPNIDKYPGLVVKLNHESGIMN